MRQDDERTLMDSSTGAGHARDLLDVCESISPQARPVWGLGRAGRERGVGHTRTGPRTPRGGISTRCLQTLSLQSCLHVKHE